MIIFLMLAVSELNLLNCSYPPAASPFQSSLFVLVLTISVSSVYPFTIISLFLSDSQKLDLKFYHISDHYKCFTIHVWTKMSTLIVVFITLLVGYVTVGTPKKQKEKNSLEENISYFSKIKIQKNINLLIVPLS